MVDHTPNPVVGQLSALLEQFTDENIDAARQMISTHGWPDEVEEVSIETILERCREDRDLLGAACESGYLNTQPTTMIAEVRDRVQAVLNNVTANS
jgi:hypothetical protein